MTVMDNIQYQYKSFFELHMRLLLQRNTLQSVCRLALPFRFFTRRRYLAGYRIKMYLPVAL